MRRLPPGLLEEMAARLVAELHPLRIILFGSHAWGTPGEDSDIDLLIVVGDAPADPLDVAVRGHSALSGMGVSKDILVRSSEELEERATVAASLERKILDHGRVIYG
ncbi:MAG: nucleotidyltransferase domain-containing protein [Thermoflexaceae bacterium]|nr:nucleotidyltransferase domain-containing protein [Thermoflexaceae bacterium]